MRTRSADHLWCGGGGGGGCGGCGVGGGGDGDGGGGGGGGDGVVMIVVQGVRINRQRDTSTTIGENVAFVTRVGFS